MFVWGKVETILDPVVNVGQEVWMMGKLIEGFSLDITDFLSYLISFRGHSSAFLIKHFVSCIGSFDIHTIDRSILL